MPKAVNLSGFYDKHNCPQRDSILGPRALQSDMLPLDHCDLRRPIPDGTDDSGTAAASTVCVYAIRWCERRDEELGGGLVQRPIILALPGRAPAVEPRVDSLSVISRA